MTKEEADQRHLQSLMLGYLRKRFVALEDRELEEHIGAALTVLYDSLGADSALMSTGAFRTDVCFEYRVQAK